MAIFWGHFSLGIKFFELIETRKKWKADDPSDPSDCKNPVITLDPMDHDPSD